MVAATPTRRILLPRPMPHQLPMLLSPARYKVLCCGRRWGKSVLALLAAVQGHGPEGSPLKGAVQGGDVWWVAPSYPVASIVWRDLKYALRDAWVDKSEEQLRITLPTGGSVQIKSADRPEGLRGMGLDGVVIDEVRDMDEEVWAEALRPGLSDRQGWAMFISTPRGGSWFNRLLVDAQTLDGWEWWQRPSRDNPTLTTEDLFQARQQMGAAVFAQEYEADTTLLAGLAMPEFGVQHVVPVGEINPQWRRMASHDWGYNVPGHHLWGAVDPEGGIIIYREWSFRGLDPEEIAQGVLYRQGTERMQTTWADPSIWQERRKADLSQGMLETLREHGNLVLSKADQYGKAGLYVQPASNQRVTGLQRIHTLLKPRLDGVPYLRIMESCPILIRTLRSIQVNPDRPEDVITEYPAESVLRDDSYDAMRYLLMGVPTHAAKEPVPARTKVGWAYPGQR